MPRFTILTPGVVSSFAEGAMFEVFALSTPGAKRVLHTIKCVQGGREFRQLETRKPVSWDVEVPEGAQLFSVTGVLSGYQQQFWVGWLLDRKLQMQALKQEAPISTDLVPGEVPIFPAIMDGEGRAALYSWRSTSTGTSLWRRVFSGDIHKAGTVTAAELAAIPAKPVVAFASAVWGELSQHALVGWLEDSADGVSMSLAIVQGNDVRIVRSEPIPATTSLIRQRLGFWATAMDRVEVAAILQTHDGSGGYDLARFAIEPASDKGTVTRLPRNLAAGIVHSAAIDYYKNTIEAKPYQTFVTTDGILLASYKADQPPMRVHRAASLDDPLPVVTTVTGAFYATRSDDDSVTFEPL